MKANNLVLAAIVFLAIVVVTATIDQPLPKHKLNKDLDQEITRELEKQNNWEPTNRRTR